MWKRIDESISMSRKHGEISYQSLAVWLYLLPNTDCKGRYPADAEVILKRCMTFRRDMRLEQVEESLTELAQAVLLHLYDAQGKRWLVLHDHDQWNPTGGLRHASAKYPAPEEGICPCVASRRDDAVRTHISSPLLSSSLSSPKEEGIGEKPKPLDVPEILTEILSPVNRSGSTPALLVVAWNRGTGYRISHDKGEDHVKKAIDRKADPIAIERAFWDPDVCRGKKIWEVLDPLCTPPAKPSPMDEAKEILRREGKM